MKNLYQQSDFPIFQNRLYETAEEAINCPSGDISLVEELHTGLVFNAAFQPALMVYDSNYNNEQATSSIFQQHLNSVSDLIEKNMGRDGLIEVGCGKGFFLELLLSKNFNVYGFDPTYEGANSRIKRQYFEQGIIKKGSGLILRHILEHIYNPIDFLDQLKIANNGGLIYIEVPCFDWVCENHTWFDIFYEHVNYFRMSDFKRIFGTIVEMGKIFGGQYLYVIADLATLRMPGIDINDRINFPTNFVNNIKGQNRPEQARTGQNQARTRPEPGQNQARTRPEPGQNRPEQARTVIWGGGSKGVIFALLMDRMGQPINTVIDINPAKHGKYLPATGLLVQSPADALQKLPVGSNIYVMNPNYLEEIKQMSNHAFNYIGIDNG